MYLPKCILLMSGKRKSGKDFLAEKLVKRLNNATVIRISEPVKDQYAKQNNLEYKELMTDGPFKEIHRRAMIEWSDTIRAKDPGFFCKITCNNAPSADVWIVSDIRRKTDINWFYSNFSQNEAYGVNVPIKTLRVTSNNDIRMQRGWVFTGGVDDVTSECDLDDYEKWDLVVSNNTSSENGTAAIIADILNLLKDFL